MAGDDIGGRAKPRLVVGVGASAGGFEAFKQLLSVLPRESGMAWLLVQHLDPNHESMLVELLASHTDMRVVQAEQGVELRRNTIYVIPPGRVLTVEGGRIVLTAAKVHRGVPLPVNHLFHSLAREYGPRSAGVILSGAGSDGAAGLREIKSVGGLAIVQDPSTSGQRGMPQSAIETGTVDLVMSIRDMPEAIERFAGLPAEARDQQSPDVEATADSTSLLAPTHLAELATLLESELGFDLRVYKTATVARRVVRRMVLSGFDDAPTYLDHLRDNGVEQQALVRDLLISVTGFYRDPEAFRALRELVIAPMVANATAGDTLRVWVPGCATGEEPYSIAMEILDELEVQGKVLALHVFATDVDADALTVGRTGIYSASVVEQVSQQRLETYFHDLGGDSYQVASTLRDVLSFSRHDLVTDPPFSRMNLVSCRNVLIYLTEEAQKHVLSLLHFALRPDGHLFLSGSESTGTQRELFSTVSKRWRIYGKVGDSPAIAVRRSKNRPSQDWQGVTASRVYASGRRGHPRRSNDLARRAVLDAWVPPTIIVSEDDLVLFMHGELGPYLQFPQGEDPRLELHSLLRTELAMRARGALYKCRRTGEPVESLSSPDTGAGRVRITAKPAPGLNEGAVMLSFEEVAEGTASPAARASIPADETLVDQLEQELAATREDLRSTVEELEASNEELRSSHEESMSMNEELQSANEELEATTEELRSLNEELTTVNAQLREKVEQVEQAHDDLNNFFSSAKVATVFLDERLRIKRFTPTAAELLGIDPGDVGRYVGIIARELFQHELEGEAQKVLEHLGGESRELQTHDGRWFARTVLPYRTESRRIEGVVVTFTDVTELKSATERLSLRERQQAVVARIGLHALRGNDLRGFMDRTVREVQETLGTDYCKILELQPGGRKLLLRSGVGWRQGLVGAAYVGTGPDSQAGYTLQSADPVIVDDLAAEKRFSGPTLLREHQVVSGLSCVIREGDHDYGVIGAHTTIRRAFTREDANFLQAVATVIGSAIGRYQTRLRLAVEGGIAKALAEPSNLDAALVSVLDCFHRELDASVCEVWRPRADDGQLRCELLRVVPPADHARCKETFCQRSFSPGEGLVGEVFQTGRATWTTELAESVTFVRKDAARELGLLTGVAFPLRAGNRALGVITVFSTERLFVDAVFLSSLEATGRSIGDFIERANIESRARRLAAITESSHDAILSYDDDRRITEWLAGAERLFGYTTQDVIGKSIDVIVPEDRREELRSINARIRRGEVVEPFETTRVCKDGRVIEVSVRSSPVKDHSGKAIGISSTDRDVTRQKETERKLVEADRQKDEFIAMLGHELRNPLAAIRTAAELLKLTSGADPRLSRTQTIIERQTAHMAKLLDGLLDVSRIIRGKIKLEREILDFAATTRDVACDVVERLEHHKPKVRIDVPDEPILVKADRVRLAQIIDNLLSNAVKYTGDGGTVTVSVSRRGDMASLAVRDTGIGIEPDLMPYIFDVFRQSKQSLDRSHGGLGLGLALVKSLAELHGGSVEARSEGKDRGAEFIVRLPVAKTTIAETGATQTEENPPLNLVVIEDNEDAAEMLQQLLQMAGHRVTVANDGPHGISVVKGCKPDVVLCDLGLPDGVSGFDVAEALRKDPEMQGVRMVALSGYGRPEDKERGKEAGFDAHITKPVDLDTLQRVLSQITAPPAAK